MREKDADHMENKTSYEKLGEEVEKDYVNPGYEAGKITLDTEWAFQGSGWKINASLDSMAESGHGKTSSPLKPAFFF